jgi:hypothetical protein
MGEMAVATLHAALLGKMSPLVQMDGCSGKPFSNPERVAIK